MQNNLVPFIEFRGTGKHYDGKYAVRDLDLTIYQGEFFVLVGGSGSGKSTTLRMINALIEPTDGNVYLHGKRIKDYDIRQLRHQIGYVLQQIALFPTMTVAENIELMPDVLGWPKAERKTRVNELLELVELDPAHYRDRYPHELSGGEQQRIGILRAIAAKPQVLLMDESYFGGRRKGRRGRGAAGKVVVFGILKRNGRVYTVVVDNAKSDTLMPVIKQKIMPDSIAYTDSLSSYDKLDVSGFIHYRINHSKEFADRQNHINGIENFWNQAKRVLRKYNGIDRKSFPLFLKECEFRFNFGTLSQQLKILRDWCGI